MKVLQLFICIFLLAVRYKSSGVEFYGYEGEAVTIPCSHKWAENNRKYFCKDPCKDGDVLIDSIKESTGRYHLKDLGTGQFTVEITQLNKTDSGKYWCGVDRAIKDTYNEVILTVLEARQTSPPPTSTLSTQFPTTIDFLENFLTSNATQATDRPTKSDQSDDVKTPGWKTYLIVSVCVFLLTSLVWTLLFLTLYYKVSAQSILQSLVASRCCLRRKEHDESTNEGNPTRKQDLVLQSHLTVDTEPDYENILTSTSRFLPGQNIYSNQ